MQGHDQPLSRDRVYQRALLDQADTTGVWMSFFPVAKKGTSKMRGCMDARYFNQHLMYHHCRALIVVIMVDMFKTERKSLR